MAIHIDAEYTAANLARRLAKIMVTEGPHCHTHISMAREAFEELAEQMGYRVERIQPEEARQAAWEARSEANPAFTRAVND